MPPNDLVDPLTFSQHDGTNPGNIPELGLATGTKGRLLPFAHSPGVYAPMAMGKASFLTGHRVDQGPRLTYLYRIDTEGVLVGRPWETSVSPGRPLRQDGERGAPMLSSPIEGETRAGR